MPLTQEAKNAIIDQNHKLFYRGEGGVWINFDRISVERSSKDHVVLTFFNDAIPVHRTEVRLEVGDTLFMGGPKGGVKAALPIVIE